MLLGGTSACVLVGPPWSSSAEISFGESSRVAVPVLAGAVAHPASVPKRLFPYMPTVPEQSSLAGVLLRELRATIESLIFSVPWFKTPPPWELALAELISARLKAIVEL